MLQVNTFWSYYDKIPNITGKWIFLANRCRQKL